jgi:hypothetical protein
LAVNVGAIATPLALVVTVAVAPLPGAANVPLAPLDGAVKVTLAPLTRLPPLSLTVTCKAAKAVFMTTLCVAPLVAVIVAGGPTWFVRLKFAGPTPEAVAATLYGPPAMLLAVKADAVATPLALVVAVVVVVPFANVPLGPVLGAVNVTVTPSIG